MERCDADEHFYDESKHSSCPYCIGDGDNGTKNRNKSSGAIPQKKENDEGETVATWNRKKPVIPDANEVQLTVEKPVVGWLVIIKGDGKGTDFKIIPGMNTIGRKESNTISIDFGDTSISREKHCTIMFDYKTKQPPAKPVGLS